MKYRADKADIYAVIEHEEDIGWYVYIFSGEKCIADYLQDSLQDAKQIAEEEKGIDINLWRTVD